MDWLPFPMEKILGAKDDDGVMLGERLANGERQPSRDRHEDDPEKLDKARTTVMTAQEVLGSVRLGMGTISIFSHGLLLLVGTATSLLSFTAYHTYPRVRGPCNRT